MYFAGNGKRDHARARHADGFSQRTGTGVGQGCDHQALATLPSGSLGAEALGLLRGRGGAHAQAGQHY